MGRAESHDSGRMNPEQKKVMEMRAQGSPGETGCTVVVAAWGLRIQLEFRLAPGRPRRGLRLSVGWGEGDIGVEGLVLKA